MGEQATNESGILAERKQVVEDSNEAGAYTSQPQRAAPKQQQPMV